MTVDSAMTITLRESDQMSRLITRGLRLAAELESKPARSSKVSPAAVPAESECPLEVPTLIQPQATVAGQTDWAEVWLQRGHHRFRLGDYAKASMNYDQALQHQPHLAAAHNGKGNVFYTQHCFEAARLAFCQALRLQPNCAYLHSNLGSALYWLSDLAGAVLAYRAAIQLQNHPVNAYYGLGVALHRQGKYQKAMMAYDQTTQINPRHADSHYGLGCLRYITGDHRGAVAAYRKAMQCNPYYTDIYLKMQLQGRR
ncbi:TPR repeat-containing protein YrrB [Acaryochloris thomasi RCC1774]|uniref:TPR repeat-containing protein YrrB n=1 Tax=Acaryochloris thomasi RCC1774 TaxID=1764569 RepID=A0A2W1JXE9_9CYAN|nr:tetratricopeptide repeat protein [Acaryochloris thomasi]PZD74274.1 TPR repeat-containing protein YrrB [Acaryochloris thomasi RCC1774]